MDIHNSVTGVHNSIQNIRNWIMYSMNVSNDGYPKFITIMDRVTWGKTPVGANARRVCLTYDAINVLFDNVRRFYDPGMSNICSGSYIFLPGCLLIRLS